jgi:hypothetical protein
VEDLIVEAGPGPKDEKVLLAWIFKRFRSYVAVLIQKDNT